MSQENKPVDEWKGLVLDWSHTRSVFTSLGCVVFERWKKEEYFLFNDALNTFYLRLYGIRHMVKDYLHSEWGNLLPPHGLLFLINSKSSFKTIITQPLLPVMVHGLLMGPPWRIDLMNHHTMSEHSYYEATSRSYLKDESTWHIRILLLDRKIHFSE